MKITPLELNDGNTGRLAVTVRRAAHLLDYSTKTIKRMVDRGELHATGRGRGLRIVVASIDDYLNGGGGGVV